MNYEKTVRVAATAGQVWSVWANLNRWPDWTASMTSVDLLGGPLREGAQVRIRQPRLAPATWTVDALVPGSSFSWSTAALGVKTTAEHRVVPVPDGAEVTLTVRQTGPLAPLVGLLLGRRVRRYVDTEAAGVKKAAEVRSRAALSGE
ncbi:MAG: SRPBCC family protein [Propionibacteriaceae bacterium]